MSPFNQGLEGGGIVVSRTGSWFLLPAAVLTVFTGWVSACEPLQRISSTIAASTITPWKQYIWYILAGAGIVTCEIGTLVLLLRSDARRRRDERALRDVSGRLINAQEDERRRIARELHDDINQQLAMLAIELQGVERAAPQLTRLQLTQRLRSLWARTNTVSEDLQRISHRLHPSRLEFLGLAGALRGLGEEFKRHSGVEADVQIHPLPALLSKEVSLALFRVAQEALHNCRKHSKARHMVLELFSVASDVVLRISDDGVGFDVLAVADKSLGIPSMEERLRLIEGTLEISSHPGAGTQIEARVPLRVSATKMRIAR
jgi:signal transduction histidine kinase